MQPKENQIRDRRAVRLLFALLIVYAVLVSTHRGEFWPFSIYPMFSQPGSGWTRSLVMELDSRPEHPEWETLQTGQVKVKGKVFPLDRLGLNQNDLSDLVSGPAPRSESGRLSVRNFFRDYLQEKSLVVYLVQGRLDPAGREVQVAYTPLMYLLEDTLHVNPGILK